MEKETSDLFGRLWEPYDDRLFEDSLALFAKRFQANGFPLEWFKGKRCLDAGCGGGRYSIAMARLGGQVEGCDISETGLMDARRRVKEGEDVRFRYGSVLNLPMADNLYDFACCSGVLHHTERPNKGVSELARVLKPGGKLYLLVYGLPGVRWQLICNLRPYAQTAGLPYLESAVKAAGLPPNKRRTFLDDLFVPVLGFFQWDALKDLLEEHGFTDIERWEKGKLDHEESFDAQWQEIEQLKKVFEAAELKECDHYFGNAFWHLEAVDMERNAGLIGPEESRYMIWGEGNHRVLAVKEAKVPA